MIRTLNRLRLSIGVVLTVCVASAHGQCVPSDWCSGTYLYDGSANIKTIGADTYTYDVYGRLTSGTADVQRSGVQSLQNYAYDSFGNFTSMTRAAGSVGCVGGCELSLSISSVTNHITGAQYDVAGNLIAIDTASYTYDAAGSLVRSTASDDREFIYTAEDERIATKNGVSWTWTVRGLDKKVLREFTSASTTLWPTVNRAWAKDYVWRDGGLLAAIGSSFTQHYHLDHLATPRVVSNAAGAKIGVHSYYPFGAELDITPHESSTELLKFTGHERDVLPGGPYALDNMHARYDMATMGRFLSIDPSASSAVPASPQSWNRYAYALNNPIAYFDPNGREWRKYADAIGLTPLLERLSRDPGVAQTLARYDGPNNPDLKFERAKLTADPGEDPGGRFVATIGGDYQYDQQKLAAALDKGGSIDDLTWRKSGQYVQSATLKSGLIRLDTGLKFGISSPDAKSVKAILHELGHADFAARDIVGYLKVTGEDKNNKNIPHDDRDVEKDANSYERRHCGILMLCPAEGKR